MDNQVRYFCELIKNVIHPTEDIQLGDEINWSYLVQIAKEHNIFPLFVEEAVKYSTYTRRHQYDKEMRETLAIVGGQVRRTNAFLQLYEAFSMANVKPIVVKGIICRKLYGHLSDHRPSGDEDIFVSQGEYWQAKEILNANGYVSEFESETVAQLEQLQEISFFHPTNKLHIELHLNPMGRETELRAKMSDCFGHVFEDYMEIEINGVSIRTMTHQDHLLFLILHAFRHFMTGGLGIRQMLDILLYQECYGSEIDIETLNKKLQEFKADTFYSDMICIGNMYFGFKLDNLKEPNYPEDLLEDMIFCGVFGNQTQAQRTAITTIMIATKGGEKNSSLNLLSLILKSIFPSRTLMREHYPYLEEKPWLLPVEWIKRWGRFIKHNSNINGNLATESMKISQRRIKVLKKYDLV